MRGNPYYFTQFTTITFRYQKTMMSKKLLRVTQLINNFVTMDTITCWCFTKQHTCTCFYNIWKFNSIQWQRYFNLKMFHWEKSFTGIKSSSFVCTGCCKNGAWIRKTPRTTQGRSVFTRGHHYSCHTQTGRDRLPIVVNYSSRDRHKPSEGTRSYREPETADRVTTGTAKCRKQQ